MSFSFSFLKESLAIHCFFKVRASNVRGSTLTETAHPGPRTTVIICMSCFRTGGPGEEQGTNKPPPTREFRKGQKETPPVRPPPRILLSGIHLGWTRCAPPGRTLSQNDWLKTTRKLIPSPWNLRLRAMWQSSPGFPYPSALHPFPVKSLALSVGVSPTTIHFQVLDKSPVSGPGRGPPSCNNSTYINSLK